MKIFNKRGFTVTEVIFVAGLMMISLGGVITISTVMTKQTNIIKEHLGTIELENALTKILADGKVCTEKMTNPSLKTFDPSLIGTTNEPEIVIDNLPASDAPGAPIVVQQGTPVAAYAPGLVVDEILLKDIQSTGTPNSFLGNLIVEMVHRNDNSHRKNITIPMLIKTDPAASTANNETVEACMAKNKLEQQHDLVVFDTPGSYTFTVPEKVTQVYVEVLGAGGAGGWGRSNQAAGGGGSGGFAHGWLDVDPGDNIPVVVGSGALGATANVGGVPGGTSSFGIFSCTGGRGGYAEPFTASSGGGGTCGGGLRSFRGSPGGDGDRFHSGLSVGPTYSHTVENGPGGRGGDSQYGGGGASVRSLPGSPDPLGDGGPGAGGGGSWGGQGNGAGQAGPGGNGGHGLVVIQY